MYASNNDKPTLDDFSTAEQSSTSRGSREPSISTLPCLRKAGPLR
ncbi:hypothetical protein YSA_07008 [Pseudomonas putida ND6]|uniref:Uncharacterized protein n=1 Tax=Pseudomonas putida ND6 TaxID=231023 RepID=I3UYI0_PSEPU|nr:hypothetical protein YSA_07008 [Pseudomonas putida ND6]